MISVRLSEEEYSALRRLCAVTGARSVSDLTRDAMRVLLNGVHHDASPGNPVEEFRAQVRNLDRKVEQLEAELTMFKSDGSR